MIRMSTIVKVYHKRSGDLGITIFVTQNSLGSPFSRGGGGTDVEGIHQETCSSILSARNWTNPARRRDPINNGLDGGSGEATP